jgi:hypothetical protein
MKLLFYRTLEGPSDMLSAKANFKKMCVQYFLVITVCQPDLTDSLPFVISLIPIFLTATIIVLPVELSIYTSRSKQSVNYFCVKMQ